jgi:hypothetical protein
MVGFKVFSASLLVALSIAAPLAQISAPVTNPNGSPAGEVSLSNPMGPPQGETFGQQPEGFPPAPGPPGFEQGPPPAPEAEEIEPTAEGGCAPRVWYQPWTWMNSSSCTIGTGEVESTIEID